MSEISIKNILDKKLKKDYQILVPYSLISKRIDKVVQEVRKTYKLDGFRKGQVPDNIIKEKYEASIMAEESEKIINETSKKIIDESNLKLAISPKVDVKVFEPQKDFEYTISMELFPEVPKIGLDKIKLTKKDVEISKSEVDEAIKRILAGYKKWDKQEDSYKAKKGDAVNIDYTGRINGEEFEGGSSKGYQLELGSKSFIDNFEDQLIGKKAGDEVKVKVRFPKDYNNKEFADKKAEFEVKVNFVLCGSDPKADDEFVKKNFGLDSFSKLEEAAKGQIEESYNGMSRNLFKKELFDFLNKKFSFDLPQGLIEEQFNKIWSDIEEELKKNPDKFKNEKEKEKAKKEKRKLSEHMIRSGIILSEISRENKIEVSNEDMMQEINKKTAQFPGQEKMVAEYYQKNPQAVQDLRGIILEDKVIDFILEKAVINNKKSSTKDLEKEFNKKMTS